MKKILIVDDEEDMIWSLQKNLNHESLKVDIITASSGEEALKILAANPVDLIITDIKMPGISGLELLVEVKNRYPKTGVIVMTAYPSPEYKNEALAKGGLHYIEKPFDINELRKIIKRVLKETSLFKGTVAGVELSDIIQLNCLSKTTTALAVNTADHEGIIYFDKGDIVHAACNGRVGEEAFYTILCFEGGTLETRKHANPPPRTINQHSEALLMEGARRMDEAKAGGALTAGEVDSWDFDGAITPEKPLTSINSEKTEPSTASPKEAQMVSTKEEQMGNLQELLTEFTNIPGVNTACLVGRDGFLLDSVTIAGTDAETIGAIASSGFGASESMGNQLGKGMLTMTMIEYENGPVMLAPVGGEAFLVIVADKNSNLGMIRLKIKKHAGDIATTASI
ncbi:MAG: response regulator [Desulfobulbaceae bacterium]|nr:response regulator [Desulfobulbaceae bacterium]HIJ79801.1 response regulator [Deltaproteobacteria bacterium]